MPFETAFGLLRDTGTLANFLKRESRLLDRRCLIARDFGFKLEIQMDYRNHRYPIAVLSMSAILFSSATGLATPG